MYSTYNKNRCEIPMYILITAAEKIYMEMFHGWVTRHSFPFRMGSQLSRTASASNTIRRYACLVDQPLQFLCAVYTAM